jgi:hypothetical protein
MKACLSILVVVALFTPFTSAQDKKSNDLNTLLRDTSYVFNRFEEVSDGIAVQIDTKYPEELRKGSKSYLSWVLIQVRMEKPTLNALLNHSNVSSADLFDVYTTLAQIASELKDLADEFDRWGDQKLALDLAQLGAKADDVNIPLAVTLRSQIATQEASCSQRMLDKHK